jgi:hypothetical protein
MAVLVVLALCSAVASAVRGLWSPCGLSVLSSINPVAERARAHRYWLTAAWYVAGAAVGGLALGGGCALAATGYSLLSADALVTWISAAVAAVVVLASDVGAFGVALPTNPRQLNVSWLTTYRRWVYAGGFGVQIGTGFATYIMSGATYLTAFLAVLTARPATALGIGVTFGTCRGVAVLVAARARTPERLRSVVAWVDAASPWSVAVVRLVVAAVACTASWYAGGPIAAAAAAAVVLVVLRVPRRGRVHARLSVATLPPASRVQ